MVHCCHGDTHRYTRIARAMNHSFLASASTPSCVLFFFAVNRACLLFCRGSKENKKQQQIGRP